MNSESTLFPAHFSVSTLVMLEVVNSQCGSVDERGVRFVLHARVILPKFGDLLMKSFRVIILVKSKFFST